MDFSFFSSSGILWKKRLWKYLKWTHMEKKFIKILKWDSYTVEYVRKSYDFEKSNEHKTQIEQC